MAWPLGQRLERRKVGRLGAESSWEEAQGRPRGVRTAWEGSREAHARSPQASGTAATERLSQLTSAGLWPARPELAQWQVDGAAMWPGWQLYIDPLPQAPGAPATAEQLTCQRQRPVVSGEDRPAA